MTDWGPYLEYALPSAIDRTTNSHTYRLLGRKSNESGSAIELEGEADAVVKDDRIIIKPRTAGTIDPLFDGAGNQRHAPHA